MKTIFKIIVSPIIFIFTAMLVWFPLNIMTYLLALFGFFAIFRHIFYFFMKWEYEFNYPIDYFEKPIHNYFLGATIHFWSPFYATYLFLFKEEDFKTSEFNIFSN